MDLPKTFTLYLRTQGASGVTIRNYLSDLNHFLAWMELALKSQNLPFILDEPRYLRQYFTPKLVEKYKTYLTSNSLPLSTINRRLSTLRALAKFCLAQAWITENPTRELGNVNVKKTQERGVQKVLEEFKGSLEAENNSANTIKNYLADLREFFTFVGGAT